ncbi:MAG: hypothetical protein CL816_04485 [Coxiellaceae bacterium]|nr:hypothetical protein [Coxiellaceae bacterium]|tara:strand:+ start:5723 stop:7072 length:1350 start_codon:yes stop_codon:yes gene_type:complete
MGETCVKYSEYGYRFEITNTTKDTSNHEPTHKRSYSAGQTIGIIPGVIIGAVAAAFRFISGVSARALSLTQGMGETCVKCFEYGLNLGTNDLSQNESQKQHQNKIPHQEYYSFGQTFGYLPGIPCTVITGSISIIWRNIAIIPRSVVSTRRALSDSISSIGLEGMESEKIANANLWIRSPGIIAGAAIGFSSALYGMVFRTTTNLLTHNPVSTTIFSHFIDFLDKCLTNNDENTTKPPPITERIQKEIIQPDGQIIDQPIPVVAPTLEQTNTLAQSLIQTQNDPNSQSYKTQRLWIYNNTCIVNFKRIEQEVQKPDFRYKWGKKEYVERQLNNSSDYYKIICFFCSLLFPFETDAMKKEREHQTKNLNEIFKALMYQKIDADKRTHPPLATQVEIVTHEDERDAQQGQITEGGITGYYNNCSSAFWNKTFDKATTAIKIPVATAIPFNN